MAHYISLFVRAVFVENMALAFFPRDVHLSCGVERSPPPSASASR